MIRHILLGLTAVAFSSPALAQVTLASSVQEEIVTVNTAGERKVSLTPPIHVAPGDTVIVRIAYANTSAAPAANVVISNPVPDHLKLVDIREGGEPAYSVDGGASFGALSTLTIAMPGLPPRPAQPADVTHVQWRFARPLAPGASGAVAFAARLD